jgi:hypothetical protein
VLSLEFGRILELDPDVHAARTTESRIKLFEMVRCGKENAALGSCDAIKSI